MRISELTKERCGHWEAVTHKLLCDGSRELSRSPEGDPRGEAGKGATPRLQGRRTFPDGG